MQCYPQLGFVRQQMQPLNVIVSSSFFRSIPGMNVPCVLVSICALLVAVAEDLPQAGRSRVHRRASSHARHATKWRTRSPNGGLRIVHRDTLTFFACRHDTVFLKLQPAQRVFINTFRLWFHVSSLISRHLQAHSLTITGGSIAVLAFESTPCTTLSPPFVGASSASVEFERNLPPAD